MKISSTKPLSNLRKNFVTGNGLYFPAFYFIDPALHFHFPKLVYLALRRRNTLEKLIDQFYFQVDR